MRTIGALTVAFTYMSWRIFRGLNFASAITWTFVLVNSGYLFGSALGHLVGDNWGLFSIALLAMFLVFTYVAWKHVKSLTHETLNHRQN